MSLLKRVAAPPAGSELAATVAALFSNPRRSAPPDVMAAVHGNHGGSDSTRPIADVARFAGTLGTSALRTPRLPWGEKPPQPTVHQGPARLLGLPSGLGTAATRVLPDVPAPPGEEEELFCPAAVRDDVALGEQVNEALVDWAEQVGIYPGQLDRLKAADFGRLIMLTHPATDDVDRLVAAGKCIVAEWATDDHFLDEESLGADATVIGARLAVTYGAIDPVDLPMRYSGQLDDALSAEPVAVAYRSAFQHLGRYASASQVARLHHELAVMFMAYNQEANWRATGRVPPVWEYLTHRHENSFLPPMVLVDPIAGYEVAAEEFSERRVRRAFCLAGTASVVLNDLYSKAKESEADFDLPKLIAAEENCSPEEAIRRTVDIHNELMHTFMAEAAALSAVGSPALRRFFADIWAWLGGNREWHSTTQRYNPVTNK